jgi:putative restriction endonuclease
MADAALHSIEDAVEKLYDLHVGVVGTENGGRHERPHKPALLLAALDLIADGQATADEIPWSTGLRDRFEQYFSIVRKRDDQNTPQYPFHYLQNDGIWTAVRTGAGGGVALEREPLAKERDTGRVLAALAGGLERFVLTPSNRTRLRHALVERFFPDARARLEPLFRDAVHAERVAEAVAADEETAQSQRGRNQGFRRKVLQIYDYQCTACGLRINIPDVLDGTFVDAAHLIPFRDSRNDHPTNGLALCKNHHWAMDRFLIAPGPEAKWRISSRLIAHRSEGERQLTEISGRPVLPPTELAYRPSEAALRWRCERLLG